MRKDKLFKYRVIQWGTGGVGTHALRFILDRADLELVALKCHSESKVGVSAGELCNRPNSSVVATNDWESILAVDADCVLFMPRDAITDPTAPGTKAPAWVAELVAILASGKNVVSPIQSGIHWRHLQRGEDWRRKLHGACIKGNSSVLFTGIDPGFTSDCLAISLASLAGGVERVRTWEAMDYSTYDIDATGNFLGFGTRGLEMDSVVKTIKTGWGGSLWLMADAFGINLDDIVVRIDTCMTSSDYTSQAGNYIAAGTVGAVWWSLTGMTANSPFFTINHITRVDPKMALAWPSVGERGGYRVEIDGSVPLRCELPLGVDRDRATTLDDAVLMTASRCVSAVPLVVRAPAGYLTLNDVPSLVGWPAVGHG